MSSHAHSQDELFWTDKEVKQVSIMNQRDKNNATKKQSGDKMQ